jgi:hypothetical protein
MTNPRDDERFEELLEKPTLTAEEWRELDSLAAVGDVEWLDQQIREGFAELERTGQLERVH